MPHRIEPIVLLGVFDSEVEKGGLSAKPDYTIDSCYFRSREANEKVQVILIYK